MDPLEVLPDAHGAEYSLGPGLPQVLHQLVAPPLPQLQLYQGNVGLKVYSPAHRLLIRAGRLNAGDTVLAPIQQIGNGLADAPVGVRDHQRYFAGFTSSAKQADPPGRKVRLRSMSFMLLYYPSPGPCPASIHQMKYSIKKS